MRYILHFLDRLTISQKLWAGAGLLLAILAGLGANAVLSQKAQERIVSDMVEVMQPIAFGSMELSRTLSQASTSLGFYLVSGEQIHRERYLSDLEAVNHAYGRLTRLASDADTTATIQRLSGKLAEFNAFQQAILEIVEQPSRNLPALKFGNEQVGPIAQEALQVIGQMVQSEMDEEPDPERRELLHTITTVRYIWTTIANFVRSYLAFRNESILDQIATYREALDERLAALMEMEDLFTLDQADGMEQLMALKETYMEKMGELVRIHGSPEWRTDSFLIREQIGPLIADIRATLDALVTLKHDQIEQASQKLNEDISSNVNLTILLVLGGFILGTLVMLFIGKLITCRINAAVHAMTDIAEGDGNLSQRLDEDGFDEIADLSRAFNKFVGKIQGIVDLVLASSTSLSEEGSKMTAATNRSRDRVALQQDEINLVAGAISDMSTTVSNVAEHALAAEQAARHANDEAEQGQGVVRETISAIDELSSEVNNAAHVIHRLEAESENIGSVLSVIKQISDQTSLLALNAAIEAARAGDQGRGFAVVADEVRCLSQQIQDQTEEIHNKIGHLQAGAREAVSAMEKGIEKTVSSVELAGRANAALDAITGSVATITDMNARIAQLTDGQARSATEIAEKVATIREISREAAEVATQASASGNEFSVMAGQLHDLVRQFTHDGARSAQQEDHEPDLF